MFSSIKRVQTRKDAQKLAFKNKHQHIIIILMLIKS